MKTRPGDERAPGRRKDAPQPDPKRGREPKQLPGDEDEPDRYEAPSADPVDQASEDSMDGSDAPSRNVGRLGPARERKGKGGASR